MKRISGRRMCTVVQQNGWKRKRINGSHHIFDKEGVDFPLTIPVHGNRALKPGTQAAIMKTAGISSTDL
ncbi:MAG: type II toxin-antitoxin system HicA family toxin [Gammaproteobacteria bacterium]|nr:type II toxin-antitoxin system HicA family toxin [Gammaproteobacteria bacterium]MCY4210515.1 type II toxin-antitoxin system HicA family toxin [Gammaproteobacteria bacterium]MCY4282399.1 type II toxin-antitoxin system HicA family toxin [Gammaproteobacteria bacterium]MCY4337277.1 type II toxin-antitoxin system HicA family toxin [Gammaproteobacteria bacterium]